MMWSRKQRQLFGAAFAIACGAGVYGMPLEAQEPLPDALPPLSAVCRDHRGVLHGPILSVGEAAPTLPPAEPQGADKPLPINLATALRLAGARPVIIAAAQSSVQLAEAELAKANVLWLPSFNIGTGYYRHDGATQGQSGNFYINSKDNFLAGAGLSAKVSTADAMFAPLAARQILRSRAIDVQTARNDALLAVAVPYFDVQQARGRLAATRDVVEKALALGKAIDAERVGIASLEARAGPFQAGPLAQRGGNPSPHGGGIPQETRPGGHRHQWGQPKAGSRAMTGKIYTGTRAPDGCLVTVHDDNRIMRELDPRLDLRNHSPMFQP
jgi:hypothetical protein